MVSTVRGGEVRENQSTRVQKLTKMQKNVELLYENCTQQFFFARFARRLFVPLAPLLNLFRRPCVV